MSFEYILLDLDGTVTDSAEGVINSVAYALEKLGCPVDDKSSLMKFIGPPLTESFKDFYNFDEETIQLG
ncbi:MAG: HAD hydrolase-like protein, partial [Clostridia bacterium]|nr:HAD hydrolase-like protein [Clostridia bacterium]